MQQLIIENNRPTGIKEDGTKIKYYSREEVIQLVQYAMQYAQDRHMSFPHTYWDEWIDNNVK